MFNLDLVYLIEEQINKQVAAAGLVELSSTTTTAAALLFLASSTTTAAPTKVPATIVATVTSTIIVAKAYICPACNVPFDCR
jgi:hypothetical protein